MKFVLTFFILLIFSNSIVNAQSLKSIAILDKTNNKPIPLTTIKSIKNNIGTYTNENGICSISSDFNDSIYISSIGYSDTIVSLKNLIKDYIYLIPKTTILSPIIISTKKLVSQSDLGILNPNKSFLQCSSGFGEEFGLKIILNDTTRINKIHSVTISAERYKPEIPMLLHIYNIDSNGRPSTEILGKNLLITKEMFNKKKKQIMVDISRENIVIDQSSFFISVEWLPVPNRGNSYIESTALIFTQDVNEPLTFSKTYFYNKTNWSGGVKTNGSFSNNIAISAKIYTYEP